MIYFGDHAMVVLIIITVFAGYVKSFLLYNAFVFFFFDHVIDFFMAMATATEKSSTRSDLQCYKKKA